MREQTCQFLHTTTPAGRLFYPQKIGAFHQVLDSPVPGRKKESDDGRTKSCQSPYSCIGRNSAQKRISKNDRVEKKSDVTTSDADKKLPKTGTVHKKGFQKRLSHRSWVSMLEYQKQPMKTKRTRKAPTLEQYRLGFCLALFRAYVFRMNLFIFFPRGEDIGPIG